jgi:thiamine-phosphate pyrophosphorylase
MNNPAIKGLYAITDERLARDKLLEKTMQVIKGGASLIQYRAKNREHRQRVEEAQIIHTLCQQQEVLFIINDDIMLAKEIGADGVHLGKNDTSIQQARVEMGEHAIIGASCYDDLELAIMAQYMGADYIAFGSFFPSATKPDALCAPVEILGQAKARLSVPIVAIGGITPHNAPMLIDAGADAIAVIHGLFGHVNPGFMARQYAQLFNARQYRSVPKYRQ